MHGGSEREERAVRIGPDSFHISGSHALAPAPATAAGGETMARILYSLSLSFFPSTTISLCLKPTSERVSFTCSRKLLCGVSQSGAQPGAGGAAGVGDPQIHCNEWRNADRSTGRQELPVPALVEQEEEAVLDRDEGGEEEE